MISNVRVTAQFGAAGEVLHNLNRTPEDGLRFGIQPQILLNGTKSIHGIGYVRVAGSRFPLQDAQRARTQRPRFFQPALGVGLEGTLVKAAGIVVN